VDQKRIKKFLFVPEDFVITKRPNKTIDIFEWKNKRGGEGSGNFGHEGRPGEIGGSGGGGSGWKPSSDGGIEKNYDGVKFTYWGKEGDVGFENTYSDEQYESAVDVIPEKDRKLIDKVMIEPGISGSELGESGYEFGGVQEGTNTIHIWKAVMLNEYGSSFEEQFAHEVGHLVARREFGSMSANQWQDVIKGEMSVSKRGNYSPAEDFAETYSQYVNNNLSKEEYPQRYDAIKSIVG